MKNFKKIAVVFLALVMVVSVFTACDIKITPQQKILGAWRDSTATMGYEFLENNACKITYADVTLPLLILIMTVLLTVHTQLQRMKQVIIT